MTWPTVNRRGLVLTILLVAGALSAAARDLQQSFDMQVPVPPSPVPVNGRPQLIYELHLTSFASRTLHLQGLTVLDPRTDNTIAELRGDALAERVAQPGAASADVDPLAIAPGARAVVYFEIELASDRTPPSTLEHRIEYTNAGVADMVQGARMRVRDESPPVLGPPLRGGPWAAVHHPSWPRGHRRFLYAVNGGARIPGRFAIDWVRIDAQGSKAHGDQDVIANWLGQGADVLAVADALVVAARDDVAESERLSTHPRHPLQDATGNYIALDLGNGRYAFYEHLESGSVRVERGQRVRRGQVIAGLGFSGHSTGPHLHFHVADTNSPLGAEGMPFVLERFEVLGSYEDIELLGKTPWTPLGDTAQSRRTAERPAPNVVVTFDIDESSGRDQ
jgi:murein DD-endopeptidase